MANRIASTACVKGLKRASRCTSQAPDSCSFHSGYSAVLRKNIGKMTKFMVPAKFSSCFTYTDSTSPSAPSISAASRNTGRAAATKRHSRSMPKANAAASRASICASDSVAPPSSLQARIHHRGSGAVSSRRITPISRS
jgi:hypothetical protein